MLLFASSGQLGGTALTLRAAVDGCPCPYRGGSHARSRLVKLRRARRSHSGGFLTRRFARHILKWSDGGGRLPVLRGPTGNGLYVMLGFVGQFALPRKPVLDSARAGVVSGGCKAKIAELVHKITQESRRGSNRLHRIERVLEPDPRGSLRHELRDALRSCTANDIRLKAAFLEKESDEKWNRQLVRLCRCNKRVANFAI